MLSRDSNGIAMNQPMCSDVFCSWGFSCWVGVPNPTSPLWWYLTCHYLNDHGNHRCPKFPLLGWWKKRGLFGTPGKPQVSMMIDGMITSSRPKPIFTKRTWLMGIASWHGNWGIANLAAGYDMSAAYWASLYQQATHVHSKCVSCRDLDAGWITGNFCFSQNLLVSWYFFSEKMQCFSVLRVGNPIPPYVGWSTFLWSKNTWKRMNHSDIVNNQQIANQVLRRMRLVIMENHDFPSFSYLLNAGNFREWSTGWLSIIIPATPSNPSIPYVKRTTKFSMVPSGKRLHNYGKSPCYLTG